MIVVKDIECPNCGVYEIDIEPGVFEVDCEYCGAKSKVLISAPRVHGCDSFNPHYDIQLGKHFESAEHKKGFLRSVEKDQVSGPLSPRKSSKSLTFCTKDQAKKAFGRA